MKKLSILLVALFITANATADEQRDALANLTLAAAETGSRFSWTREAPVKKVEARADQVLEQKTLDLNEEINAKLEKALEEKLNRSLNF